jgi:DtxR family transcriptional regulator, Mn-dependent transcriptional regulator
MEDYVKVIFAHTEWQPEPITSSVLASRLGLAPSSVTEMVKKLGALSLVDHKPYGAITLTADGLALAVRIVRKHRLIETWLVQHFGYSWDEVHDEAEILEHALSDRLLDSIDEQLGFPTRDPHGDPIPSKDGTITTPEAVVLADATAGSRARVVRISDRDPSLLRHLEAQGIVVDAPIRVIGRAPFGGAFAVDVGNGIESAESDLGDQALQSIWIAVDSNGDTTP